jgi:hypothetical protein
MNKTDAEDLLSLASLIHRRLDSSRMLPKDVISASRVAASSGRPHVDTTWRTLRRRHLDPAAQFWDEDPIGPGLTLIRLGGHFDGGTVLHWADWSESRGELLSGDILQVLPSNRGQIDVNGKQVVAASVARYIARGVAPLLHFSAWSLRGGPLCIRTAPTALRERGPNDSFSESRFGSLTSV